MASQDVRDGDSDLDWRPAALAGDVHQSSLGLDDDVVPRVLSIGAGGSIS